MRSLILASAFAGILFANSVSAADYAKKGSVATTTTNLASGLGGASGGKLVVPNAPGSYPLIVASHGFSASADNQVGWAEQFASYGFVVVAPTFPNSFSPDHVKNGEIIKALVAGLAAAETPAKGKIDTSRVGLAGHSAGGLATTLAAADLKPLATVLFDPVDNADRGKAAYAKLCGPVLDVFAGPSSCNNNSGWFDFRTTAKGPTTSFRVKGSTHCDGENAPRSLCGFTCGGAADATRQAEYARYATAFFLANLTGDTDAAAQFTTLSSDSAIGEVSVGGGASCVTLPTPTVDAGVDAGADVEPQDTGSVTPIEDATPTADTSVVVANDPGTDESAGCGCTTPRRSANAPFALVMILALVLRRRR